MFLTKHARHRMEERGITYPMLLGIIESGETSGPDALGRVVHELYGYRVVTGLQGAIVTVTGPKRRRSKYNPKKASRAKRQQTRAWLRGEVTP